MRAYILIAGILVVGCQPAVTRTPDVKIFATVPTSELVFQGNLDMNTETRIVQRGLKRESLKLNLKTLNESDSDDEFRLWVGFGLMTPTCFTLKRVRGAEKAMYYATKSKRTSETSGMRYQVIKIANVLSSPKSGWKNLDVFLRNKGVDSPIKLTSDIDYPGDEDGETIVIEVKSRGVYNMVFFPTGTKSPDGLKALEICHKIETEFNIRMGC
jgi:hypothetical protein